MADPAAEEHNADESGWARHFRARYALLGLFLLVPGVIIVDRLGVDISGWSSDVLQHLESVPPHFIVIAVLLKGGESVLTSLAWAHVLRATYPERQIPYRLVLAGHQGGIAVNAVAPVKAGTLATFGLLRLNIRGARIPTLVSTFAVNSIAFTAFAVVNVLVVFALFYDTIIEHLSAAWQPGGAFLSDRPLLVLVAIIGAAAGLGLLVRCCRSWAGDVRGQIAAGGAILRAPRRYLACVFLPALGSWACRWGYTGIFMAAFDIPVTFKTVFLLLGARLVSSLIAVTPGGIGITQAVDVAVMSAYAPADVITASSIAQDMIFKAWSILFGLVVVASVFGWRGTRALIGQHDDPQRRAAADSDTEGRSALAMTADASPGRSERL